VTRYLRTRNILEQYSAGHSEGRFFGSPWEYNQAAYLYSVHTEDYIGRPIVDKPFISSGVDRSGVGRLTTSSTGLFPGDYTLISNWIPERLTYDYGGDHALSTRKGDLEMVTETLARTNPSRPVVSLGTYLQDLAELPKMLFNLGSNLRNAGKPSKRNGPRSTASSYLGVKFGWVPLFDDINTLLDVSLYISRRNKELHNIFQGKGSRHNVNYGTIHNSFEDVQYISSGSPLGLVVANRKVATADRMWCVVRWKPTTSPGWHPSEEEYLALAKKVVSGATASGAFASAWDLIPWTWLLGWLINVRAFVLANGNTIPAASSPVSVMRETKTTQTFAPNASQPWAASVIKNWSKRRFIYSGSTFGAFLPHLDAGRLSVLGALAVQRLR
jgi:hypothetical protein